MAKKAAADITAFDVLLDPAKIDAPPVCVFVGHGGYLQHEARLALVRSLFSPGDDGGPEVFDGNVVELRDVMDGLAELSLFGGDRRVVVVEEADALVKNHREALEDYVTKPVADAVLVLEVETWPGNTRLAKAVAESGLTVRCEPPAKGAGVAAFSKQLKQWLATAAQRDFDCELAAPAIELMLDELPSEAGILYQEIARLSLLTGPARKIDAALVRHHVGGWRTQQTWDMIDAAVEGRTTAALEQLARLIAAGDEAQGIFPQMASSLRKLALAARIFDEAERRRQSTSLRHALEQAGTKPFLLGKAEAQLKRIGRARCLQLYKWLLQADLELKGHNSAKEKARRVLELLIVRLASPQASGAGKS